MLPFLLLLGTSPAAPPPWSHSGAEGRARRLSTPLKNVLFIEYEQPCYAGPCDARRSFWAYACGWSYDWRRCGAPDASEFSYFGYPSSGHDSYDPGYPSRGHFSGSMTPDIPHATMTPAPTTPDIHHATMTSAPTTPVSYSFQMEESRPPHQWNYPIYEGKGEDMRLGVSKGKGRLPAYEREYPLPKPPSVPPLHQLGVNLPMPPPPPEEYAAVPTTPPMPRPTGIESPPPPPSPLARGTAFD